MTKTLPGLKKLMNQITKVNSKKHKYSMLLNIGLEKIEI